jgi:hypothetical protein
VASKKSGEPGWSWRRWVIFPNIAVSFFLLYLIIIGPDSRVNETVAWGLVLNIIASVMFYTGFATAQDIAAIFATRSGLPYSAQSSPALPTPGTEQGVEGVPPAETVVPATEVKAG